MWKCPQRGVFIGGASPPLDDRPPSHGCSVSAADDGTTPPLVYYGVFLLLGVLATAVTYALTETLLIAAGPIIVGVVGVVYHLIARIPKPNYEGW
jgi:MYXO-CTERM domain-containing protein